MWKFVKIIKLKIKHRKTFLKFVEIKIISNLEGQNLHQIKVELAPLKRLVYIKCKNLFKWQGKVILSWKEKVSRADYHYEKSKDTVKWIQFNLT
jgi:hypothetical protein